MAKHVGLQTLLKTMVEQDASDLHITVGIPPEFRIAGKMVKVKMEALNGQETRDLCYSILNDSQKAELEKNLEIDFSFGIKDLARFRGNLFFQRGAVAGVFRRVPIVVPDFDSLGLPPVLKEIIRRPNGMILVTGPTGSGKSTTLAALLDLLNREEHGHILTIEDPIEFVHPHKNCVINQREVGVDTKSFPSAMRRLLRQDPDYVLVGELRDNETIEMCMNTAETGHLVFGTLHTNSAVQSINRLISVFPAHQQPQVRQVLSFILQGVVSQQLIPRSNGSGRVLALEIMIPNAAIRNLIREDKLHQLYSVMQSGQEHTGMQTMNQSLLQLFRQGALSRQHIMEYSHAPEELEKMIKGLNG
ncbi:MAG: type IV pilus twitching motility protein PilT [Oligoflexia bacterium]|nr:type IV pilus twitching motility protein PilT [Oligoflexia bacterium]